MKLPFIEVIITTKCNFHCFQCSNLIPSHKSKFDVPVEEIIMELDSLLAGLDHLDYLKLHGGEPFLYNDLDLLLDHIYLNYKIGYILIPTNGSYLPSLDTLEVLKKYRSRIRVIVSSYSQCVDTRKELASIFEEYSIDYSVMREKLWYSFGPVKDYGYSDEQLLQLCMKCEMRRFPSYFKGVLYPCSRAANAAYLGLIPQSEDDYLNLVQAEDAKKCLNQFFEKQIFGYCRFCNMNNERCIKSGVQSL